MSLSNSAASHRRRTYSCKASTVRRTQACGRISHVVDDVQLPAGFLVSVLELVHPLGALALLLVVPGLGLAVALQALLVLCPCLGHSVLNTYLDLTFIGRNFCCQPGQWNW